MDVRAGRTLTAAELSDATRRAVVKSAKRLLAGVGQLPSAVEQMALGIHYRRALTDEELASLPAAWRALPALHHAGRGTILEENT